MKPITPVSRIVCTSDLHGELPDIPDCDLLFIAGDILPLDVQRSTNWSVEWLDNEFRIWLDSLVQSRGIEVVGIAGNHDFVFQRAPERVPELPWHYLKDSGVELRGLKIWGSPWQPWFHDWAFNLLESELAEKWGLIPDDTQVLLTHGPPFGYGDTVGGKINGSRYGKNLGSSTLTERIKELKFLQLHAFGHIHSGQTVTVAPTMKGYCTFLNCSYLDEQYRPSYSVVELLLDLTQENPVTVQGY